MTKPEAMREARERINMSQRELGLALGYPECTAQEVVSYWEIGKRGVPRKLIKRLTEILQLDPVDMI